MVQIFVENLKSVFYVIIFMIHSKNLQKNHKEKQKTIWDYIHMELYMYKNHFIQVCYYSSICQK